MRVLAWVLVLGLGSTAWAAGPLEVDHPLVAKGRAAYEAGKYEDALSAFEEAKRELPNDPAVEYNRAVALAQLGRAEEAKSAFQRVTESNRPELQGKAWYNLGNIHATTGARKEALQAYRRALKLDPNDELARHNYEVVLRNLPPPQQGGSDGGTDGGSDGGTDGGRPDAGQDGGKPQDGGTPVDGGTDGGDGGSDAGQADGGSDGGADGGGDGGADAGGDGGQQGEGQGDGGSDGGSDAGSGEGEGEGMDGGADGGTDSEEQTEYEVDAGVSPEDIDRQEAERLLDAMKQNEKNLQLWRFQQKKKQRKPNEKDW
ncbi:tetratricopeptide repeat protein [Hyalangium gracile]|uniref:tetratricopeptide repeat protein n=1 Tax=Hyalangium gracile TaxID=394092 RepID=UPI001CCC5A76|nr:tetratricopeptide repeat protein [Hyalangium gracile]